MTTFNINWSRFINSWFQTRGHNIADLDPLGINSADLDDSIPPELELATYGLSKFAD